jgi:hypothetical protein
VDDMSDHAKFIQITGVGPYLYALDDSGAVWELDHDEEKERNSTRPHFIWKRMTAKRET